MKIIKNISNFLQIALSKIWAVLPVPLKSFILFLDKIKIFIWGLIPRPLKIFMSSLGLVITTIVAFFGLFFLFPDLAKPLTDRKGQDYNYASHQDDIIHLDQGWNEAFRHKYYFTPQGSEIIPLKMALALEGPNSTQKFFGSDGLAVKKYGYIPYPKSQVTNLKTDKPSHNLNIKGLPLGFTIDGFVEPKFKNTHKVTTPMLGINCAACHTSNMKISGKTVRIDGNQGMGDFMGLLTAIDTALAETYSSNIKFDRFAERMGAKTQDDKENLRQTLKSVLRKRDMWQRRNTPDINPGHGRVDAFGVIFNQVTARDLHLDSRDLGGNGRAPNAPVSYPVLWDTPHMARVQWNGSANNKKAGGVLGRNFGQVLGVFGRTEVTKQNANFGHCSTVKRRNLNKMDYWIRSLNSPKWTDPALKGILPEIKDKLVSTGASIYNSKCASCHAVIADEFRDIDPDKKDTCDLPITMVDANIVGTDPFTALTGIRTGAKTGLLEGLDSLSRRGEKMTPEEPFANVLREVVTRSIVGSFRPLTCDNSIHIRRPVSSTLNLIDAAAGLGKIAKSRKGKSAEIGGGFDFNPSLEVHYQTTKTESHNGRDPKRECGPQATQYIYKDDKKRKGDNYHPFGYKARPLNGIWASAPYLHNGSVPTLSDMLSPVADPVEGCPEGKTCRPEIFYVGNINYDPKNVGYIYDQAEGYSKFDTTLPGNSNAGHLWGTALTDPDKAALLEYLKTL